MSAGLVLPILFLLLFLSGILIFVAFYKKMKFASMKITYMLFAGYSVVLLLSMVLSFFLPKEILNESDRVPILAEEEETSNLYLAISKGAVHEIDNRYLAAQSTFDYNDVNLKVGTNSEWLEVFVERKAHNDKKVEAFIYGKSLTIEGYDFSARLLSPDLNLDGGTLSVKYPEHCIVKIQITKSEFPINQFAGHSSFESTVSETKPILFLRIPKNLNISPVDEKVTIEWVR